MVRKPGRTLVNGDRWSMVIRENDLPGSPPAGGRTGAVDLSANAGRPWVMWMTSSPASLWTDRVVAGAAGIGLLGATAVSVAVLATGRSFSGAAVLAVVAGAIAVCSHTWTMALLVTRTPPRTGRNWEDLLARNKAQKSFRLVPVPVRLVLMATLVMGLLVGVTATVTALGQDPAGVAFDRLVAGLFMFAFSVHAAVAASELVRRAGGPQMNTK